MSPELIGIIAIVVLLILMYARMWVGLALLFTGFCGLVIIMGWDSSLTMLGVVPYRNIANYTLSAIPLFVMMGVILYNAGIASDLFYSAHKWIGHLGGGLAMASAIAGAILGVVTDSMVAVVTLGKVAVPEMKKYNYDESLASGSILAGATLASLVPPSVGFILYAILTGASVGKLFIGAIIPGIVLTVLVILLIGIRVKINPRLAPPGPKTSFKEKIISLKHTWSMGLAFLLIIGGIYAGVFTPTEAGAIGAFGSILIALIARRLTLKKFIDSILETAQMTAMIVLMVAGAYVFTSLMAVSQLPFTLADFIIDLNMSKYLILVFILFVYIIMGTFCDIMACIIITVPIIFPAVKALGFDPVWYGVLIVMIIETGLITPPIGMNVFVLSAVTKVPIGTIFRGTWQFVAAIIVFIIILILFPQTVTFLPDTM